MSTEGEEILRTSDEEEEEVKRRRSVRECYSAEWSSLRRRGSHQEFQLEWSVLSWEEGGPGNAPEISPSSGNRCRPVGVTSFTGCGKLDQPFPVLMNYPTLLAHKTTTIMDTMEVKVVT